MNDIILGELRMQKLVNPMDSLKTFEPALKRGELRCEPGRLDPSIIVHMDTPQGSMRATYAQMRGDHVVGIAIIVPAGFEERVPVYQIGYAVPQHMRRRGIARKIAATTMAEFTSDVTGAGVSHFYIEAMVSPKNIASLKVANHIIGGATRETVDQNSGQKIIQFIKEFYGNENIDVN